MDLRRHVWRLFSNCRHLEVVWIMPAVLACYSKKRNSILDVAVVAAKTNVLDVEVSSR